MSTPLEVDEIDEEEEMAYGENLFGQYESDGDDDIQEYSSYICLFSFCSVLWRLNLVGGIVPALFMSI